MVSDADAGKAISKAAIPVRVIIPELVMLLTTNTFVWSYVWS